MNLPMEERYQWGLSPIPDGRLEVNLSLHRKVHPWRSLDHSGDRAIGKNSVRLARCRDEVRHRLSAEP